MLKLALTERINSLRSPSSFNRTTKTELSLYSTAVLQTVVVFN